jgi:putative ABC transport system permease protein
MIPHDIRYAFRVLRRSPGFTAAAVATLALGIGANTALFSVVDALLLKSLAVQDPDSLVLLSTRRSDVPAAPEFSYPLFSALQTRNQTLTGLVAAEGGGTRRPMRVPPSADVDSTRVSLVSHDFFDLLGVKAHVGRVFAPNDETPAATPTAVLSNRYWKSRFAGNAAVIGQTVIIENVAFTIVGVAPPLFFGNVVGESPDVWVPASVQPQLWGGLDFRDNSSVDWLMLMGRLRPGVSHAQAQADLQSILEAVEREWKETPKARGLPAGATMQIAPGRRGFSELRERFDRPLRILMGAVCLVLLVACLNVASLLVARNTAREREIAIRVAVGGRTRDLARQFLAESLVLSAMGGGLGLLLGFWGTDSLLPLLGDHHGAPIDVRADVRLILFTLLVTLVTGVAFGMMPLRRYMRRQVSLVEGRTAKPSFAFGRGLVVTQIGLSLVLVVGAGLFVRTLQKLRGFDAGFDRQHVLMLRIDPQTAGYQPSERAVLNQRLAEAVRAIPGVRSMSQSVIGLMSGRSRLCCITVPGYTPAAGERMAIRTNDVTPEYFATVGMTIIAGRTFTEQERALQPRPVIVNEAFARKYFNGAPALGQWFAFGNGKPMPIVGVVADARYDGFKEPSLPLAFFPAQPQAAMQSLEVRAVADSRAIAAAVRRAVSAVDPRLPVRDMFTIEQLVDSALAQERLMARLSGCFGGLALALACVGIYGLLAQLVARRTNEIGVRMALGADRRQVVGLVVREVVVLVVPGILVGLAAAVSVTRISASLLFGVTPFDPAALTIAALSLVAIAVAAAYVPAYRAASITPLVALRHE